MIELSKPLRPLVLVILDGWGIAAPGTGNAIELAHKPFVNSISASYPHTQLNASGESVGLPRGEAGNSEVGHLNTGAGRIVYQDLSRINSAIADGSFLQNEALNRVFEHTKQFNSNLHLLGLVGTGVVHASNEHLYALLWAAKEKGIKNVYLHLFTDGRDSSPMAGLQVVGEVQKHLLEIGIGRIATLMGRYWSMDRDNHWERIKRAYQAITLSEGIKAIDPRDVIQTSYQTGTTDEFIEPTVFDFDGGSVGVRENDSVVFFNFRPDRARQLTKSFVLPNFTDFDRGPMLKNLAFVSLTEYEKGLPVEIAFQHQEITQPIAKVVSDHLLKQLHIGETEKYAHVTYFFNGGREDPFPQEDRVHIPSPKVKTYDLKPEMSALEITDYVVNKINSGLYQFYVVNFANADMVAHTGSLQATIKAVETLDLCLKKITEAILGHDGCLVTTSDHGNAEEMINPVTDGVDTEHTTNPVPLIIISKEFQHNSTLQFQSGILADVAPTILNLMGITKPGTMMGQDLLGVKNLNKSFE